MSSTIQDQTPTAEEPKDGSFRASSGRTLRSEERRRLAVLAMPTTALALAITVVSTYLGEIARRYTHSTALIGVIVGSEGIMALWIPLLAGAWSDRLRTRIGGRLPFLVAGTIPASAALVVIGFLHSLLAVAIGASAFFAFYFVAYEPYRALYPDLLDSDEVAARAQSTQAVARGIGTGAALLGGGLLLSVARPLPFVLAAAVLLAVVGTFVTLLLRRGLPARRGKSRSALALLRELPQLIRRRPALRYYFIANALWETALSALKAFVILYLTIGLGYGLSTAALLVGGVALIILLGAIAAGKAGDRFGPPRVLQYALVAYGGGFLVLVFTTSRPIMAVATPLIAIGGGAVMTLAYAVLMPLMPSGEHGLLTGYYSLSRGVGIVTGPIAAGLLIEFTKAGPFASTQGFQAVWIVSAAAILSSVPMVARMRRASANT